MNKHRNSENRRKYEENFPNTDSHSYCRTVPWGRTWFCFDSFKTRWGKNSGADYTEKSCLSSGIDGMNYTSFPCRTCITESLKIAWWCWEVWQGPWDAVLGQPTYYQEVSIQLAASALGKHPGEPCSPASLFPSLFKEKFQNLVMVLSRNRGLGLMSWQYSLIQRGAKKIFRPQTCAGKLLNVLQLSQCTITELLILLPLCSPVAREIFSHTCACTQKLALCISLCRFKLETYHSIKNNTIRLKLSRQYTVGRS